MYVMKFLKENIQSKELIDSCIEIISYLHESDTIKNGEYFSIYECRSSIDIPKKKIYQVFHILIDLNILKKYEFAICPVCDTENKVDNINTIKCNYCKSTFSPDDINERFKFIYE